MTKTEQFMQLVDKYGLTTEQALNMINSDAEASLVPVSQEQEQEPKAETTEVVEDNATKPEEVSDKVEEKQDATYTLPKGYVAISETELKNIMQRGAVASVEHKVEPPQQAEDVLAKLINGGN